MRCAGDDGAKFHILGLPRHGFAHPPPATPPILLMHGYLYPFETGPLGDPSRPATILERVPYYSGNPHSRSLFCKGVLDRKSPHRFLCLAIIGNADIR